MTPSSDMARTYSRSQAERFQGELSELLRIPSLSGDPARATEMCIGLAQLWSGEHGATAVARRADQQSVPVVAGDPVDWVG
jgi:hypothetical protein